MRPFARRYQQKTVGTNVESRCNYEGARLDEIINVSKSRHDAILKPK
jgi:hypothetical protein